MSVATSFLTAKIIIAVLTALIVLITACEDSEPRTITATLTAEELAEQFMENEARADAKYKGKFVRITGKVEEIESGGTFSDSYITLYAGYSINMDAYKADTHTIDAYFDDKNDLIDFDKRERVTLDCKVKGKDDKFLGGISIKVEKCDKQRKE